MWLVSSESRPKRAMNQGAPAATTSSPGCSGSTMRRAPRSRRLVRSAASRTGLPTETLAVAWRQLRIRFAGAAASSG